MEHVYLIDFGIARHFKPGQTKDTVAFGSAGYAAPEQYGKAQTTPQLRHLQPGRDAASSAQRQRPVRYARFSSRR